jgi:hypothetical protein
MNSPLGVFLKKRTYVMGNNTIAINNIMPIEFINGGTLMLSPRLKFFSNQYIAA